jgi:predicted regulator of Ras-like GTPase activity (Roadblock/LC7/MglB family)
MAEETKNEKLSELLKMLRKTGNIKGSAIISVDGLLIASDIYGADEDTFAAMSAAMFGSAETAVSELKQGKLNQVIVEAEKCKVISVAAGEKTILVMLTEPKINLGLALLELSKTAQRIESIIKK